MFYVNRSSHDFVLGESTYKLERFFRQLYSDFLWVIIENIQVYKELVISQILPRTNTNLGKAYDPMTGLTKIFAHTINVFLKKIDVKELHLDLVESMMCQKAIAYSGIYGPVTQ